MTLKTVDKLFRVFAVVVVLIVCVGLYALSQMSGDVVLTWTATGDDDTVGTAAAYDLRESSIPIDSSNFEQCRRILNMPVPKAFGSKESYTVTGLSAGWHWFAIKARDNAVDSLGNPAYNWSKMSNVARKWIFKRSAPRAIDDLDTE